MRVLPIAVLILIVPAMSLADEKQSSKVLLAIHGGAGVFSRERMTPEIERAMRADLEAALKIGHDVLSRGGSSLDAVEKSIRLLEDSPHFNAGKGSALTRDKTVELDASIMCGSTLGAGAVAGVTTIKNPITAARAVMEQSGHVLLVGASADQFAKEQNLETVEPTYFHTDRRLKDLEDRLKRGDAFRARHGCDDRSPQPAPGRDKQSSADDESSDDHRFGTVGAVALDNKGHLAAGTSTGGITAKRPGRIGDSPIIGAGTYADDRVCAVSATGDGEYFIRATCARTIAALIEYKRLSLKEATDDVLRKRIKPLGGEGGVIVLSPAGELVMDFTTEGMYRGYITADGSTRIMIYRE
jgi:beta-aspartyl-peptidase (threonine type)